MFKGLNPSFLNLLTYLLAPCNTVLWEANRFWESRNSLHIMDPEGLLPHSQMPATCPYPALDESSPCPHLTSWRSNLILASHLRLGLPSYVFPSGFPSCLSQSNYFSKSCALTLRVHSDASLNDLPDSSLRPGLICLDGLAELRQRKRRKSKAIPAHALRNPRGWGSLNFQTIGTWRR